MYENLYSFLCITEMYETDLGQFFFSVTIFY